VRIVVLGAGGHAQSCLDVIASTNAFEVFGLVDPGFAAESIRFGHRVIGGDECLAETRRHCGAAVLAIGQIRSSEPRRRLTAMLQQLDFSLPVVTSSSAYVSADAEVGFGTIVMHGSVVGPGVAIGSMSIVNSNSTIEHGCVLGSFVHVAPGAVVNGDSRIGSGTFVGSGAVIHHGIDIGSDCLIAAGSIVRQTLPDGTRYAG